MDIDIYEQGYVEGYADGRIEGREDAIEKVEDIADVKKIDGEYYYVISSEDLEQIKENK